MRVRETRRWMLVLTAVLVLFVTESMLGSNLPPTPFLGECMRCYKVRVTFPDGSYAYLWRCLGLDEGYEECYECVNCNYCLYNSYTWCGD